MRARPIDPRTLTDLPGFTPLELGHHYRAALSPDRGLLAVVVWPVSGGGSGTGGVLHLVDPTSWTERTINVRIDENLYWLGWSEDATRIYWVHSLARDTDFALFAANIADPRVRQIARLPAGFMPYDARLVSGRLVVVGNYADRGLASGYPAVVFVDPARGLPASVLELRGLRLGQYAVDEPGQYPYRMILPALAWDVPHRRLVVVDAEGDWLRVVDLERMSETGPDRILTGPAKGPASGAKMVSTTRKAAALSADGRWLYVSGLREDVPANDPEHVRFVPIALQRIDLSSVSETARVAGGARTLLLSADGSRLIAAGDDVTLLDASDLHELARYRARSYASATQQGDVVYIAHRDFAGGSTIRAVDLANGILIASRDIDRHVADLILVR